VFHLFRGTVNLLQDKTIGKINSEIKKA